MKISAKIAAAALAVLAATSSQATTLFTIAPELGKGQNGDCVYNTNCGPVFSINGFAAQLFTLAATSTVTGFGFNAIVRGTFGTEANYRVLSAAGGVPGALIASGNAMLFNSAGPFGKTDATTDYTFSVSPVQLNAGSYFLAFQDVTGNFSDFLSKGVASSGAFTSVDGGDNYVAQYRGFDSVAISVFDGGGTPAVPEPATWALMLLGFGITGATLRARRRATALA